MFDKTLYKANLLNSIEYKGTFTNMFYPSAADILKMLVAKTPKNDDAIDNKMRSYVDDMIASHKGQHGGRRLLNALTMGVSLIKSAFFESPIVVCAHMLILFVIVLRSLHCKLASQAKMKLIRTIGACFAQCLEHFGIIVNHENLTMFSQIGIGAYTYFKENDFKVSKWLGIGYLTLDALYFDWVAGFDKMKIPMVALFPGLMYSLDNLPVTYKAVSDVQVVQKLVTLYLTVIISPVGTMKFESDFDYFSMGPYLKFGKLKHAIKKIAKISKKVLTKVDSKYKIHLSDIELSEDDKRKANDALDPYKMFAKTFRAKLVAGGAKVAEMKDAVSTDGELDDTKVTRMVEKLWATLNENTNTKPEISVDADSLHDIAT